MNVWSGDLRRDLVQGLVQGSHLTPCRWAGWRAPLSPSWSTQQPGLPIPPPCRSNPVLFYRLLLANTEEILPFVCEQQLHRECRHACAPSVLVG